MDNCNGLLKVLMFAATRWSCPCHGSRNWDVDGGNSYPIHNLGDSLVCPPLPEAASMKATNLYLTSY